MSGYSCLMGSDEEAAYRRLGEYREIINERVAHHGGRVFGTAGDSVVADFAVLVVTPVVLLLLAITIVGLPITIVGNALYVAALFPGYLLAAIAIGQWAARRLRRSGDGAFWRRVGALVAGMLILPIIGLIPVIGALVTLAALMIGLGTVINTALSARPNPASGAI
jgi:class 3 adenylate cyclase